MQKTGKCCQICLSALNAVHIDLITHMPLLLKALHRRIGITIQQDAPILKEGPFLHLVQKTTAYYIYKEACVCLPHL